MPASVSTNRIDAASTDIAPWWNLLEVATLHTVDGSEIPQQPPGMYKTL